VNNPYLDTNRWQLFLQQAQLFKARKRRGFSAARAFISEYRALEHEIARQPDGTLRLALESAYLLAMEQLVRPASNGWADFNYWLKVQLPGAFWQLKTEISLAIMLFIGFGLVGWFAVQYSEELAALFMDPRQMDQVRAGKVWTDSIVGIAPASVLSFQITLNNILVTLFAFSIGALYGLGTIYIVGTNGLMLGALLSFTHLYGAADRLLLFIPAHGIVELFVICMAAGCGLHVGDALINPGQRTRVDSFRAAIARTVPVVLFGCAGLVVCGLIEGYISPNPAVGKALRWAIGLGWFALFFSLLSGWVWGRQNQLRRMKGQP
jgi:uncharacterized membrane protein SpoIIM required for sporulation